MFLTPGEQNYLRRLEINRHRKLSVSQRNLHIFCGYVGMFFGVPISDILGWIPLAACTRASLFFDGFKYYIPLQSSLFSWIAFLPMLPVLSLQNFWKSFVTSYVDCGLSVLLVFLIFSRSVSVCLKIGRRVLVVHARACCIRLIFTIEGGYPLVN